MSGHKICKNHPDRFDIDTPIPKVEHIINMNGINYIKNEYRTRAIITRGLNIYHPIFEVHFFVFKEIFEKILSLLMISRCSAVQCVYTEDKVRFNS